MKKSIISSIFLLLGFLSVHENIFAHPGNVVKKIITTDKNMVYETGSFRLCKLQVNDSIFLNNLDSLISNPKCPDLINKKNKIFAMSINYEPKDTSISIFIEEQNKICYSPSTIGFFTIKDNLFDVSGENIPQNMFSIIEGKYRKFNYKRLLGENRNGKILPYVEDYEEPYLSAFINYKNGKFHSEPYYNSCF